MFHCELLLVLQLISAPLLLVFCIVYPGLEFVDAYRQKERSITAKKETMDEESTDQSHFQRNDNSYIMILSDYSVKSRSITPFAKYLK